MNQTKQELRTLLARTEARELQTLREILAHIDPEARCDCDDTPMRSWPWSCRDGSGRVAGSGGVGEREALVCGIKILHARMARRAQETGDAVTKFVAALDGLRGVS